MAVGAIAGAVLSAPHVFFWTPLYVVGDNEIEPPVFVVIKPARARGPSTFVPDCRFGGHIGERPIAIVVIKDCSAVSRDVDIGVAVVIKVAHADALAVMPFAAQSCFGGDIGERSIALVVIKSATERLKRFVDLSSSRLHEEKVHQPVLVVIEPGDTGAHGFKIVFLVSLGRVLPERNPCRFPHVGIPNGNLPFCSFDRLFGANTLHSKQYCEASGYRDQSGPEKLTNFFP